MKGFEVATDFDAAANTWDDDPKRRARTMILAEAVRGAVELAADVAVLEYGAGTGLLSHQLAPHVGSITVADASPGMVEVARTRIEESGHSHVRAVRLDLTSDPVPEERYGLIVSVMAMHHVRDVPAVLAAFHRLLEPGGSVVVADLDHDPDRRFHDHDFDGHHGFDREVLTGWLAGAGFGDVRFTTAYTVTKTVDDAVREFPIFLAVARR
jgi:2-polyprenyl-3-methyl-5-hydroxy-6-metoxy-1,4-benzoquinol methylase